MKKEKMNSTLSISLEMTETSTPDSDSMWNPDAIDWDNMTSQMSHKKMLTKYKTNTIYDAELRKIALAIIKPGQESLYHGVTVDDLMSVGLFALWRASKSYDRTRGTAAFESYAKTAIRNEMLEAANTNKHAVRLPKPQYRKINKILKAYLSGKNSEEVAKEFDLTEYEVTQMLDVVMAPFSFEYTSGTANEVPFVDIAVPPTDEEFDSDAAKRLILKTLDSLPCSEEAKDCFCQYYGQGKYANTPTPSQKIMAQAHNMTIDVFVRTVNKVLDQMQRSLHGRFDCMADALASV